jgi:phosphatidylserine decarboxylase
MQALLLCLIILLIIVIILLLFWKFVFLRRPKRNIPTEGIVSPASGRLVRIINFKNGAAHDVPKGLFGRVRAITEDVATEGQLLVIMLTPFDVHYQRAPADGIVKSTIYTKGAFKNAIIGAERLSAFENEKNTILLKTKEGNIKVIQVAGVLARRIICSVKLGQSVKKGDLIGLINLGSQVILVMPKKKLKVKVGDYLVDGETIIA